MSEDSERPTSPSPEALSAVYDDIIRRFTNATAEAESPLMALQAQLRAILKHGHDRAGGIYNKLVDTADDDKTSVTYPTKDTKLGWGGRRDAATLIAFLACPERSLGHTMDFSPSFGPYLGSPVWTSGPASLKDTYRTARAAADDGKTTVMIVTLEDVYFHGLVKAKSEDEFQSFMHFLALGVGPEGVVIWRAWASKHYQYRLNEYFDRGGAKLRTFPEAKAFISRFEKLAQHKGVWDTECNDLYHQIFGVDLTHICETTAAPPIVPKYQAWVKINVFRDVKMADLQKFKFVCNLSDEA